MAQASLSNNVLKLSGVLDHHSVIAVRAEAERLLAEAGQEVVLDCSAIEKSNSVGLSLLLVLKRAAVKRQQTLRIEQLPEDLQQMAHVSEVSEILV
ncbi:STAS domain-containing protein [Atopomonas sediminilitoris]|uniref:STAS domain-containing protein n=1 Tax=Atopomonas sediminilitoris TaxID=2919919 RepID=UPI001F4E17F5|nr:STAS domain-containing protein [Atopomonas sediminilitoris]MCJ8169956.1 STAS domain-containing protein [Atopomonas sediminilitoris]